uniref:AlNc14C439G11650 protein n=1 Tax=Albugo laibachii Nc14 TaxID=890382 RepID=F0WZQ9_9STRA|nr:AlNc14C439G11650 [Albugo laibachii Nc14]|eukprot:CCA26986.1 AlNc14C439G11650 [Albugo laibachii Nc14]
MFALWGRCTKGSYHDTPSCGYNAKGRFILNIYKPGSDVDSSTTLSYAYLDQICTWGPSLRLGSAGL